MDTGFDPFDWLNGILTSGYDITRIIGATIVVFGGIAIFGRMGFPNPALIALIVALGVFLVRGGHMAPRGV